MLESPIDSALREICALRRVLDSLESSLVVRGRLDGKSWSQLAEPLGLSKQGARKRHLGVDPVAARRSSRPPTIAEYHAEIAAAMSAQQGLHG